MQAREGRERCGHGRQARGCRRNRVYDGLHCVPTFAPLARRLGTCTPFSSSLLELEGRILFLGIVMCRRANLGFVKC